MAKSGATRRPRGMIRQRGGSFQVVVYAGLDPLTGRELKLRESTTDERGFALRGWLINGLTHAALD